MSEGICCLISDIVFVFFACSGVDGYRCFVVDSDRFLERMVIVGGRASYIWEINLLIANLQLTESGP